MLSPDAASRYIIDLQRGLRALRLNRHFPPWRAISGHLDGVRLLPPGERLRIDAGTGWPHPEEWLRVRVDRKLAPELLGRLQAIEAAGDLPAQQKGDYLRALLDVTPLGTAAFDVSLIELREDAARYEVIIDRLELGRPSLVRWTLRLLERGGERFSPDELEARATGRFERRLRQLTAQPPVPAMMLLQAEEGLEVEELVRGEVGPVLRRDAGPFLSAVLSRAAGHLTRISVEDHLLREMAVPSKQADFGLSHHRKWAVPRAQRSAFTAELRALGAKNIVYGY
ncbi:MAG: hypothetical protein AAFV53_00670 [Myxococcota bacterium]